MALSAILSAASAALAAPAPTWFKFSAAFVASAYQGGTAFGSVTSKKWSRASATHGISCGGNDGELHVGTRETSLSVPAGVSAVSGPETGQDPAWGLNAFA